MFSNAKSGDRVWDYEKNCWGTIIGIVKNCQFPIRVKFDNDIFENTSYTIEGKESLKHANPILFWDEIKFEIPKKTFNLEEELRRLEIKKFEYGKKNYYLYWNSTFEGIRIDCTTVADLPLTKYFSENKVLAEFNERIKEQKITKEEFFRVYKNVFVGR